MYIKFEDIENNNKVIFAELLPEEEEGFYRIKTLDDGMIWNLAKKWYKMIELTEDELERIEDEINSKKSHS